MFQIFWRNLFAEATPTFVHWTSFSGGLSESINHLTASAPYKLIITSGSIVFFLDLDIDSIGPTSTLDLFNFFMAVLLSIFSISSGYNQLPFWSLYVSWHTIPWVKRFLNGSDKLIFLLHLFRAFVKKRE